MTSALLIQLRDFWMHSRRALLTEHNRSVPFGDYVVDRWTRAKEYGFGVGSSVYDSCLVLGDVTVGEGTWIGPNTILDGSGGLVIGSNCAISAGAQLYSHDAVGRIVSGGRVATKVGLTRIGDNVFIGPQAVIAMGVTVGDGSAIGANSFVNSDIPPGVQAFGTPCRVHRRFRSRD